MATLLVFSIVAVSIVGGVISLVSILALVSYCYRYVYIFILVDFILYLGKLHLSIDNPLQIIKENLFSDGMCRLLWTIFKRNSWLK